MLQFRRSALVLSLTFCVFSAGAAISAPARTADTRPDLKPTFWVRGMPDTIQMNSYSCGAAVFQAVAQYFDHWGYQETFAGELGTSQENGTHPLAIVKGLKQLGLEATLEEGLTIDRLEQYLREGRAVVIDYQAWNDEPSGKDYSAEWEDGHYSILVGYNDTTLFIEDPSTLGTTGYLSKAEFQNRWHDYENENGRRREYRHMAIIVQGPASRQPRFTPID